MSQVMVQYGTCEVRGFTSQCRYFHLSPCSSLICSSVQARLLEHAKKPSASSLPPTLLGAAGEGRREHAMSRALNTQAAAREQTQVVSVDGAPQGWMAHKFREGGSEKTMEMGRK